MEDRVERHPDLDVPTGNPHEPDFRMKDGSPTETGKRSMPIGMRDRPPREKKAAPTDTARNGGTASLSLPYRHPFSFAKRLPNGKPQRQATFDRNGVAVTNPVGQRATVETNRPPASVTFSKEPVARTA